MHSNECEFALVVGAAVFAAAFLVFITFGKFLCHLQPSHKLTFLANRRREKIRIYVARRIAILPLLKLNRLAGDKFERTNHFSSLLRMLKRCHWSTVAINISVSSFCARSLSVYIQKSAHRYELWRLYVHSKRLQMISVRFFLSCRMIVASRGYPLNTLIHSSAIGVAVVTRGNVCVRIKMTEYILSPRRFSTNGKSEQRQRSAQHDELRLPSLHSLRIGARIHFARMENDNVVWARHRSLFATENKCTKKSLWLIIPLNRKTHDFYSVCLGSHSSLSGCHRFAGRENPKRKAKTVKSTHLATLKMAFVAVHQARVFSLLFQSSKFVCTRVKPNVGRMTKNEMQKNSNSLETKCRNKWLSPRRTDVGSHAFCLKIVFLIASIKCRQFSPLFYCVDDDLFVDRCVAIVLDTRRTTNKPMTAFCICFSAAVCVMFRVVHPLRPQPCSRRVWYIACATLPTHKHSCKLITSCDVCAHAERCRRWQIKQQTNRAKESMRSAWKQMSFVTCFSVLRRHVVASSLMWMREMLCQKIENWFILHWMEISVAQQFYRLRRSFTCFVVLRKSMSTKVTDFDARKERNVNSEK